MHRAAMQEAERASPYLDEREAASFLKLSPRTLQKWRAHGQGPPFLRLGEKRIVYAIARLTKWAAGQEADPTSAADRPRLKSARAGELATSPKPRAPQLRQRGDKSA